ncbi:Clp protease ClpP [Hymenobacter rubripertinctus]|uniref:Clp protease ClpP n=1 Tax=Hymenobacter rubripertinctus TaxID=2029981 RepID=A0A418QMU9_9BACT|nr:ATP-dependent Clp protease proteolytic subunit [Hymenobacter rubripertinctus]RIY06469.1 Clp protease ClpP [Hymenobacter rubripertinctus]
MKQVIHTSKHLQVTMQGLVADINIIGDINWYSNDSETFTRLMAELKAAGVTELRGYINSGGGSMYDANEIYNQLQAFEGRKTCRLGALVASAATVIACAFTDGIEGAPNMQYMIHNPCVHASGDDKSLESAIQLYQNLRQSALDIYGGRTGLAEAVLSDMMARTTWMTAATAKSKGFITAITGQATELPADTLEVLNKYAYGNVPAALNQAAQPPQTPQNSSLPNTTTMNKAAIIVTMGLPSDASDAQVEQAIMSMKAAKDLAEKTLKDDRDKNATQLATMLVDQAVQAKKIGAGEREEYIKDAVMNYDLTKKMLDRMPAAGTPATNQVKTDAGTPDATNNAGTEDRNKWNFNDYMEKDGKALVEMANKQPEQYKKLFADRQPFK